jgi:integrase
MTAPCRCPGWLVVRMRDYLDTTHPRTDESTAPLWPNRALGGSRRRGRLAVAPLDFSEPVDTTAFYRNVLRHALEAVGLPASRSATDEAPAVEGVRLHDYADLRVMPTSACKSLQTGVIGVSGSA